jgi:hypothetical protein
MRLAVIAVILSSAITFYAFFDCARCPQEEVRKLPKWAWLLIVFLFSPIGAVFWFFIGKPRRNPGPGRGGRGRIIPPDDDPDFLRKL